MENAASSSGQYLSNTHTHTHKWRDLREQRGVTEANARGNENIEWICMISQKRSHLKT